ncbi:MAG: LPS O-antigen length regulator, partial [Gammaproteobacteria bacterium]|nr:LPS O-antigen length regulator [Gammaproteobacteria bacterium]
AANNRIVYNNEVYNPETKTWAWKTKSQWKNELQPSDQEAVNTLLEKISINMDDKRGVLTIDAFHFSPFVAQQWVQLLVKDINEHVRQEDIADAKRSISYLNIKLEETSISEMRKIFYELIEVQTKTIMLAEVRGEYVLRAIDSALVPELKAKPMRSLISVLGASVGTLIGVFLSILGQSLFKNAR